ncbi:hypothetical protein BSL82_09485 [Tardibacter chloracetimidivorans]|uniref:Rhamnogalacturonase A/B/Epimerase-like pectate lyase domain-containing protein n=1 Tax=Tardibacter chloracetimidivorans TaxID=1921510 RepID=A0A1L3ZV49_9SPHN|nr:glycosyl hydrolase family 28-related protein [Tardibacter chloracetimidivorans]API59512.1 hypothetical protein BSL82_09485 [Tardibacter chloracetimidivorans]
MPATYTDRLEGLTTSVAIKAPCQAVAIANITLTGEQTVNGVAVVAGDRVLATAQTNNVDNGIWVVGTGTWARAKDFDGTRDAVQGTLVSVFLGGTDSVLYQLTTADPIVIGTTALTFEPATWLSQVAFVTADEISDDTSDLQAITAKLQFLQSGTGAVSRSIQSKLRDGTSAFDFLTSAQIADVEAGTALEDVTTVLQAALDAHKTVYLPNGTYLVSAKLIPQVKSVLIGESENGVILKGNHSGAILEYPINNFDCQIKNLSFAGDDCTGIAVASTAGTLHDYLIRPQIESCHFHYELAYGINADLIFSRLRNCSFGYYGTGTDNNTMVGLRSHAVSTNYTNLNRVECCLFFTGTDTIAAVDLSAGDNWLFDSCDWEQGGIAVKTDNIQQLRFVNCWFEGNTVSTSAGGVVILLQTATTPVVFESCNFVNNTCYAVIGYSSSVTAGVEIKNSTIAKTGSSFCIYDTATTSVNLPTDGSVAFYNNVVAGGSGSDKLVSALEYRGGFTSPRLVIVVDTSGSGTILASNDPGATIFRNGAGDISISASSAMATSTDHVAAIGTWRDGEGEVQVTNTTTVRAIRNDAATDNVVTVVVYGA